MEDSLELLNEIDFMKKNGFYGECASRMRLILSNQKNQQNLSFERYVRKTSIFFLGANEIMHKSII